VKGNSKLRILGGAVLVILLGVGATGWAMWPEVDDIPEVLEAIDEEVSIADLVLVGQGPVDSVRLGDLEGQRVFIMIEGRESLRGGEGKALRRALHRWEMPADTVGFSIGDAPGGAAVMKGKIEREFVGPMRDEMKWPIYVDYGGKITTAFSLPRGHLGLVILDAQGEVVMRHAGDASEAEIREIQAALGASEPASGPEAPEFSIAGVYNGSCRARACVLVFLDEKVGRAEIPGLDEGGFEGEMSEAFEQIRQPSVRLARVMLADWEPDQRGAIAGVVVGEAEGWEVEGWPFVDPADPDAGVAEAREAFGIGDQAALVIVDSDNKVAFSATGRIPFWQLSVAADILGITPKPYGKKHEQ